MGLSRDFSGQAVVAELTHAISPDVRSGHHGRRALAGNLASPSWLRSASSPD